MCVLLSHVHDVSVMRRQFSERFGNGIQRCVALAIHFSLVILLFVVIFVAPLHFF